MSRPGPPPATVAIVGLGCIGGSIALGLRRGLPGVRLLGVDRDPAATAAARAAGAIDEAVPLEQAATGDCLVLAVPVLAVRPLLERLAAIGGGEGRLVTDTASTKRLVCDWGHRLLGPVGFLGGHPMAGRERSGFAAATPDLFRDRVWALTPPDPAAPDALEPFGPWLTCLTALGARPLVLAADRHDHLTAATSHLPLALAHVCAAAAAARVGDDPLGPRLVGSGFRDVARMAAGDPTMAAHIAASNADELDLALAAAEGALQALRAGLRAARRAAAPGLPPATEALTAWFGDARARHARLVDGPAAGGAGVGGAD